MHGCFRSRVPMGVEASVLPCFFWGHWGQECVKGPPGLSLVSRRCRGPSPSLASVLALVGLLLLAVPGESRVAILSSQVGPVFGVSASLHSDFAPWGPPVEQVVGKLLYKGSSCKADAVSPFLVVSSPEFRPKLFRLSMLQGVSWLAQQVHKACLFFLLPPSFRSPQPPPSEKEGGAPAAATAADDAAAAAAAAAGPRKPTKGDSWRWASSLTLALRKEALASLVPFSSVLWTAAPLEQHRPTAPSLRSLWGVSKVSPSPPTDGDIQQTAAAAEGESPPGETGGENHFLSLKGRGSGGLGMFSGLTETALLVRETKKRHLSRKRVWLFDTCTEQQLVDLIKAANLSGAAALLLTDTPFRDYSLPLLGNVLSPKPLMPVASIPDSPLLQQLKRQAAAAAAAAGPPVFVLVDSLPPDAADCSAQRPVLYASLLAALLWGLLALWWRRLCCRDTGRNTTALHRLMLVPPALRTAAAAAQAAYCMQCPDWGSPSMQYLVMAMMSLDTLFQTFFFACILLISQGYLLTRETFDRREGFLTAMLISSVYVVSSIGQVEAEETLLARIGVSLGTLFVALSACSKCSRQIRFRLDYVRGAGAEELVSVLELKLQMFRVFYVCCLLFFSLSTVSSLLFFVVLDRPDWAEVSSLSLEVFFWLSIALTFRPHRGIVHFTLMHSGTAQSILPMYAASPLLQNGDTHLLGPRGDSAIPTNCPVLIVNPSASSPASSPFRGLAVGTLISPQQPPKSSLEASAEGQAGRSASPQASQGAFGSEAVGSSNEEEETVTAQPHIQGDNP